MAEEEVAFARGLGELPAPVLGAALGDGEDVGGVENTGSLRAGRGRNSAGAAAAGAGSAAGGALQRVVVQKSIAWWWGR